MNPDPAMADPAMPPILLALLAISCAGNVVCLLNLYLHRRMIGRIQRNTMQLLARVANDLGWRLIDTGPAVKILTRNDLGLADLALLTGRTAAGTSGPNGPGPNPFNPSPEIDTTNVLPFPHNPRQE